MTIVRISLENVRVLNKPFSWRTLPEVLQVTYLPYTPLPFLLALGTVEILQSCNGLLLCRIKGPRGFPYGKLTFDPTISPHYKVIYAELTYDEEVGFHIQMQTYSLESRKWSVCGQRFHAKSFEHFEDGIFWNGAIHWLNHTYGNLLHYKLDIVNEHPDYVNSQKLNIYEMRIGDSEWSVNDIVNLDDIMTPFPDKWSITSSVCWVVLGEKEEDSYMLILLHEKVLKFKIMSKTLSTLSELGPVDPRNSCYQFIPSFAGV
nr:hypothetical protein [Tanacetum cinerariifolium]